MTASRSSSVSASRTLRQKGHDSNSYSSRSCAGRRAGGVAVTPAPSRLTVANIDVATSSMRFIVVTRTNPLLQLTHHPPRRVGGQVRQELEELLHVLARDARAEVVLQETVEMAGDALGKQAAAAKRRDDEALYRPEPAATREVTRDLLALVVEAREHRRRVDADLRPDLEQSREESLRVTIDQAARALEGEVLELRALRRPEAGHAALDVLHAVRVVTRLVAGDVGEEVLQERLLGQVAHLAEGVERKALDDDLHPDE